MSEIILTENQLEAINNVKDFVNSNNDIFILTGAAGTGKTTVVKNIIDSVTKYVDEIILLAPTNRAAKVLTLKTGLLANTVHSEIYKVSEIKDKDGNFKHNRFDPRISLLDLDDKDKKTKIEKSLFIVDESSMLSASAKKDGEFVSQQSLLKDLYEYIKYNNSDNKVVFVGDSYQLPPIGYDGVAPALDISFLRKEFSKKVTEFKLTKILRQSEGSFILDVAQHIKQGIDNGDSQYFLNIGKYPNYRDFIRGFADHFNKSNQTKAMALAWRRIDVLNMNIEIRKVLFNNTPNSIEVGDLVYLNSSWSDKTRTIPKGEIGQIIEVIGDLVIKGGVPFFTAKVKFTDSKNKSFTVRTKINNEYLYSEEEFFSKQKFQQIAIQRGKENKDFLKSNKPEDDQYLSAMQLKFAYALTVHKAQGGEWETVFLHSLTNNKDLRWNYTAITRAVKNIYSF